MESERALELVTFVGRLVLENQVMRLIMDAAQTPAVPCRAMFRDAMADQNTLPGVRQAFGQLADELRDGHDQTEVIQRLVSVLRGYDRRNPE